MSTITPINAPDASGQRGFYNKYPYTDFHELNLDWLLSNYQAIIDKLNDTISWCNTHQSEYEEAIARLTAVENEINTFETEINNRFAALQTSLTNEVNQLIQQTEAELDATKKQIQKEVADAIAAMQVQFDVLYNNVKNEIASIKVEVNRAIYDLQGQITANNQYIFNQVNQRLQDFIDNLPDYENLIVYNPVRGEDTNVQTAIIDLYDCFRIYGLTASQYDSLQLTAAQYDGKGLTALEYDRWAYKLLDYPDPDYFIRDPFDGQYVRTQVVIYKLADLHKQSLTAAEYDALELTAEEYDALGLTAYIYDWYGIVLFGDALTASEYDALDLTAATYDAKRLDAWQYDVYGKLLLTA